jgi:glutamate 5-kinase
MSANLSKFKRIVVKIGSSLLTDATSGLNRRWLKSLAADIVSLTDSDFMVVSSGAIASGRYRLNDRDAQFLPPSLSLKESQAAAAIGQISLSRAYDEVFGEYGQPTAQVLLTIEDTESRRRYLNARATIGTLLKWRIVPIINENDTVATSEIRYGDNDRLAARVASMMDADLLILLSDVEGLYSAPPGANPNARLLMDVPTITAETYAMAGEAHSHLSRGGMITKIEAGKIATAAGITMVIASGHGDHALQRLHETGIGTWFRPQVVKRNAKKKWIAGGLRVTGKVTIDSGALLALETGKSLLPAGVKSIEGEFLRGDTVLIVGPEGHTLGRGLIEYDASEAAQIIGLNSHAIVEVLGPNIRTELIHRDNLALENTTN